MLDNKSNYFGKREVITCKRKKASSIIKLEKHVKLYSHYIHN